MNGEPPSVEKIVERLQKEDNLPDTIHAKQVKQLEYGNGLKETEVEIWESLPYQFRSEVISTKVIQEFDFEISVINSPVSEFGKSGDIVLQDRNKIVIYDEKQNTYKIHPLQSPREQIGHTITTTLIGSSPLTTFNISYEGVEYVADRKAYVLRFQPTEMVNSFLENLDYIFIWIDSEYWFPMKREVEYKIKDGEIFNTHESVDFQEIDLLQKRKFKQVDINTELSASIFDFDPPKDAKRID
ncbi:LolA family protein [Halorussus pelagicus]|uniref:LolA family protein n=1 Tax=Halorussus pelagicus TaxID=2505977 RepID=UPI000FFBA5D7|nr:outer membrane lipoprotein carrier protein LolA [Halorussus pelagicus]